jgi:hypothetical protein
MPKRKNDMSVDVGLKMSILPVSENAWIHVHSHSVTRNLQNWSNSAPTTRKKKLRLKETGVSRKIILIKELEQMFRNLEAVKQFIKEECRLLGCGAV